MIQALSSSRDPHPEAESSSPRTTARESKWRYGHVALRHDFLMLPPTRMKWLPTPISAERKKLQTWFPTAWHGVRGMEKRGRKSHPRESDSGQSFSLTVPGHWGEQAPLLHCSPHLLRNGAALGNMSTSLCLCFLPATQDDNKADLRGPLRTECDHTRQASSRHQHAIHAHCRLLLCRSHRYRALHSPFPGLKSSSVPYFLPAWHSTPATASPFLLPPLFGFHTWRTDWEYGSQSFPSMVSAASDWLGRWVPGLAAGPELKQSSRKHAGEAKQQGLPSKSAD